MEIGTHNSMTYLKPKKWYLYPFQFIARCQSKTIEEQFNLGIRLFDIRISYDENQIQEFRHGSMAYKGNVYQTLKWLNSQDVPIKIRLILETKYFNPRQEYLFKEDYEWFKELFKNLTFYEGRTKHDWKQIIDLPTLELEQPVSSMQKNVFYKLCPWLYAKLFNKKHIETLQSDKTYLFDFYNGEINKSNTFV